MMNHRDLTGLASIESSYETEESSPPPSVAPSAPALLDGDAVVIVATQAHRRMFDTTLCAASIDLGQAVARDEYLAFDAADAIGRFMLDGAPDTERSNRAIGEVLDRATAGGRRVRVYGEMAALLWADGDPASALALEDLCNDLAATHDFELGAGATVGKTEGVARVAG